MTNADGVRTLRAGTALGGQGMTHYRHMKGSRRSRVSAALAVGVLVLSLYFLAYLALTSYEPAYWTTRAALYHHTEPGPNRLLGVVFAPLDALFGWLYEAEFVERPRDWGLHFMGPRLLPGFFEEEAPWWVKLQGGGALLLLVSSAAFLVFKGIRLRRIFVSRRLARGFPVVTSEPCRSGGVRASKGEEGSKSNMDST